LYLSSSESRHTKHIPPLEDPDIDVISRVKAGESEAFEDLVRRHTRRIFCTLYGLLGNREEARDATQDTFMKAFEYIEKFEGRSKFSTWLTSIAVNTGTEFLRKRRPMESLDEHEEEGFRPRQIQSWIDNPEMAFGKAQLNELVRDGVLRLPEKYRMALTLRDLQQLSTEDTASALGLSIPATKARVLRGRLMLRESLTPHFTKPRRDNHV
jgi:RNA polymerase sigma-70 factor (ECF subfamily)